MDRQIQAAVGKARLYFRGEQALAADFGERAVKDAVTLGGYLHNFNLIGPKIAMGGQKAVADFMGLRQSQYAGACSDSDLCVLQGELTRC
jgi:hypothetical protein